MFRRFCDWMGDSPIGGLLTFAMVLISFAAMTLLIKVFEKFIIWVNLL